MAGPRLLSPAQHCEHARNYGFARLSGGRSYQGCEFDAFDLGRELRNAEHDDCYARYR
jgi:hypothetical protein